MTDNKAIDAVIKLLDLTRDDLRTAPLEQVINLRNLLYHWHELADAEVQKRVKKGPSD